MMQDENQDQTPEEIPEEAPQPTAEGAEQKTQPSAPMGRVGSKQKSDVQDASKLGRAGRALGGAANAANAARNPGEATKEAGKAAAGAVAKKAATALIGAATGGTGAAIAKAADYLSKIPGIQGFSQWAWKNKWLVIGLLVVLWLMPGILLAASLGGVGGGLGQAGGGGAAILPTITDQALIDKVLENSNIKFNSSTARQEISEGRLQNSILQALLAAANADYKIHINAAWSRSHPSNPKSFHHRGLALDLDPAPGLQEFLYKNAATLKINELFGPLDGSGSPQVDSGQSFGGQIPKHKDHIHIATYP